MSRIKNIARPLAKDPARAAHAAEIMKTLGHPLRLRLVVTLAYGPTSVGELGESLGAPQAIVSQQLRILRMNGLVVATRRNGQAVYRLIEPGLLDLVRCLEGCCKNRLDPKPGKGGRPT